MSFTPNATIMQQNILSLTFVRYIFIPMKVYNALIVVSDCGYYYTMQSPYCSNPLSTQSHLTTCYASRHYKTGRVISAEGIGSNHHVCCCQIQTIESNKNAQTLSDREKKTADRKAEIKKEKQREKVREKEVQERNWE